MRAPSGDQREMFALNMGAAGSFCPHVFTAYGQTWQQDASVERRLWSGKFFWSDGCSELFYELLTAMVCSSWSWFLCLCIINMTPEAFHYNFRCQHMVDDGDVCKQFIRNSALRISWNKWAPWDVKGCIMIIDFIISLGSTWNCPGPFRDSHFLYF